MITKKIIPTTGGFYYTSPYPLVADDVQAYEVVLNTTYDLTGATVRATATRADGAKIDDIGMVEGNTAKYILKNNMYSKVGTTILRLTLISEDGSVLTTKELSFEVVEGNGEANASGDDRLPVLTQLIVDTGEAKAGANAAANYANEQGDYAKGVADELAENRADWTQTDDTALDFIKNKPTDLATGAYVDEELDKKLDKTGGTITGFLNIQSSLDMNNTEITNVGYPTYDYSAANKFYVDQEVNGRVYSGAFTSIEVVDEYPDIELAGVLYLKKVTT